VLQRLLPGADAGEVLVDAAVDGLELCVQVLLQRRPVQIERQQLAQHGKLAPLAGQELGLADREGAGPLDRLRLGSSAS